jgi:hypothetical protein
MRSTGRLVRTIAVGALVLVTGACASGAGPSGGPSTTTSVTANVTPGSADPQFVRGKIGGGRTFQAILSSGQMHLTFFDAHGQELAVEELTLSASSSGATSSLRPSRYSAGHFVAVVALQPGTWLFSLDGSAREGGGFSTTFTFEVS